MRTAYSERAVYGKCIFESQKGCAYSKDVLTTSALIRRADSMPIQKRPARRWHDTPSQ